MMNLPNMHNGFKTYLDLLASGGIHNRVTFAHSAAVNAHVGQLPKSALF